MMNLRVSPFTYPYRFLFCCRSDAHSHKLLMEFCGAQSDKRSALAGNALDEDIRACKIGPKHKRFEEKQLSELNMIEEEVSRWMYTTKEMEELWHCMFTIYTRVSPPIKRDTIRKRDLYGDLIKDRKYDKGKDQFVLVREIFIAVCVR